MFATFTDEYMKNYGLNIQYTKINLTNHRLCKIIIINYQ